MSSFQRLYAMFEEELYSNVHTLAQFYLSNPSFFHIKTQEEFFCIYVLNGTR